MQNISNAAMLADASLINGAADEAEASAQRSFALDTTFVLFFLAMDLGQNRIASAADGTLSLVTLGLFIGLPYLLPFRGVKPALGGWIMGRVCVAATGIALGAMLSQAVGVLLPEVVRFVPMTMLIVATIICCNIRFYDILRTRLAR